MDEDYNPLKVAEFLEYIKTVHTKLTGKRFNKNGKPKD
jgi:hypothetical protein